MTEVFRFVHAADVHLDGVVPAAAADLRRAVFEATRRAFTALVDLCLAERVHALLVAGDLFEDERLGLATETFLVRELGRLAAAGVQTVAVTGNHDPGRGSRARVLARLDGVTLVDRDAPRVVTVRARDRAVARVVAIGHLERGEQRNLAAELASPGDDLPAVGLVHAQVTGASQTERHARYAPCTVADLRARGLDYWALGHVHARQRVGDDLFAFYPGNLQGRHAGEGGPRGALVVELPLAAPRRPRVTFAPLAPLRFETVTLALPEVGDGAGDLLRAVRAALAAALAAPPDPAGADAVRAAPPPELLALRISLVGTSPLHGALSAERERADLERQWARELGAAAVELDVAGLRPVRAGRARPGPLAAMLAQLARELDERPERLEAWAGAGFEPASGRGVPDDARRAALRRVIAGIEARALDALEEGVR